MAEKFHIKRLGKNKHLKHRLFRFYINNTMDLHLVCGPIYDTITPPSQQHAKPSRRTLGI